MHQIADEGIAAHWKYKEGKVVEEADDKRFTWLRQLLEWQRDLKEQPSILSESVKVDLFPNEVYIFTPKGAVKRFLSVQPLLILLTASIPTSGIIVGEQR